MKRTIKIYTAGPIRALNMVHGPILTPYTVEEELIVKLLNERCDVVELLPDCSEKKLTLDDILTQPSTTVKASVKSVPVVKETVSEKIVKETEVTEDTVAEDTEVKNEPEKEEPSVPKSHTNGRKNKR